MSLRSPRLFGWAAVAAAGLALLVAGTGQSQSPDGFAYSLELNGDISPATEAWVDQALDEAADEDATVAIIRLDTPGGLDSSLREIVKDILAAPMPVIVYVSPNGARAASAGVYITEAADVAAMAPQTNIGSATPISIGPGGESDTSRCWAARSPTTQRPTCGRSLPRHGRNPDLAERMVRDGGKRHRRGGEGRRADRHRSPPSERELLDQARRLPRAGPQGPGPAHRRPADREPRHAAAVRDPADPRQPDDRLPAALRRPARARRSSSSARG